MKYLATLSLFFFSLAAMPALANNDETPTNRINHWHVSTYWAEYIEGHGIGNHTLYCGDETIPACDPPDTIGGVGRDWIDEVEWRYSVTDPTEPVTVRLTGLMNVDLPDVNWDFLALHIMRGETLQVLDSWTGIYDETISVDFTEVISPDEFVGPDGDEVRFVWRVWTSADGWDDEDCINPSHGACQIDDLAVYFDGTLITYDDFEPGNPVHWDPVITGVSAAEPVPGLGQVAVGVHPNPFNPQTTFSFDLPRATEVSLAVYDVQGRLVRIMLDASPFAAGSYQQNWNGRDVNGRKTASGIYFYRFVAGRENWVGKLTMLK